MLLAGTLFFALFMERRRRRRGGREFTTNERRWENFKESSHVIVG
jgi:hypothetical protein